MPTLPISISRLPPQPPIEQLAGPSSIPDPALRVPVASGFVKDKPVTLPRQHEVRAVYTPSGGATADVGSTTRRRAGTARDPLAAEHTGYMTTEARSTFRAKPIHPEPSEPSATEIAGG